MTVLGPERLPSLPPEALTPAQRVVVDEITAGPRGGVTGPFIPMLRSPALTEKLQKVGEYLRFGAAMPERLRELAILTTARHWDQAYEWYIHAPLGLKAGLSRELLADLAADWAPAGMTPEETAVHGFCLELHRTHAVTDSTYTAVLEALGEDGLVDLTGICGYYATLAMVMNVARSPIPEGVEPFAVPDAIPA